MSSRSRIPSMTLTLFLIVATQCVVVTASTGLYGWFWSWWSSSRGGGANRIGNSFVGEMDTTLPFVDPLRIYTRVECLNLASSLAYQNATEMCDVLLLRQNQTQQLAMDNRRLQHQLHDEHMKRADPLIREDLHNMSVSLAVLTGQVSICQAEQTKCRAEAQAAYQDLKKILERQHAETFALLRSQAEAAEVRADKLQSDLNDAIVFNGQSYVAPTVHAAFVWSGIFTIFNVLVLRGYGRLGLATKWHNLAHLAIVLVVMLCTLSWGVFWFPFSVAASFLLTLLQRDIVSTTSRETADENTQRSLSKLQTFISTAANLVKATTASVASAPAKSSSATNAASEMIPSTLTGSSSSESFPGNGVSLSEAEGAQQPGLILGGNGTDDETIDSVWAAAETQRVEEALRRKHHRRS